MSVRFDAYTATTSALSPGEAFDLIAGVLAEQIDDSGKSRGFHRFGERAWFKDASGVEMAAIQHGGAHKDLVMLEVKGEVTPGVVDQLRRFPHRCTRVDSCADFDAPGAFGRLYRACRAVKRAYRIVGGKAGDWEDFPEMGRTLYLGAKTSSTRVRLYEKGKQKEYAHLSLPNWARLEIQVRPVKEAKDEFSALDPLQVWGASRYTRELAAQVLLEHVDPHPAGTTWRESSRDRAIRWACRQYGPHFMSLADELGGFDVLGLTLGEVIREEAERKKLGL